MKVVIEPFAEVSLREIAFYTERRNTRAIRQPMAEAFPKIY